MSDKIKFPRAEALKAARHICLQLADVTSRLICAGSLRRGKEMVGDVEILYIPLFGEARDGLFDTKKVNRADQILDQFLKEGILAKRLNKNGNETWGPSNKLAVYVPNGVPVDLFQASESNWWNYLVCRTGGKQNNINICQAAQRKGWQWHPTSRGFTNERGYPVTVKSERDVFEFLGLSYLEPHQRP